MSEPPCYEYRFEQFLADARHFLKLQGDSLVSEPSEAVIGYFQTRYEPPAEAARRMNHYIAVMKYVYANLPVLSSVGSDSPKNSVETNLLSQLFYYIPRPQ